MSETAPTFSIAEHVDPDSGKKVRMLSKRTELSCGYLTEGVLCYLPERP
jgi:hypothetical protein